MHRKVPRDIFVQIYLDKNILTNIFGHKVHPGTDADADADAVADVDADSDADADTRGCW